MAAVALTAVYFTARRFFEDDASTQIAERESSLRGSETRVAFTAKVAPPRSVSPIDLTQASSDRRPAPTITGPVAGAGSPSMQDPEPIADISREDIPALRQLLKTDLQNGIALIDEVVNTSDPNGPGAAMRGLSVLAEVPGPVVDEALRKYTAGPATLLRAHAANLLQRRGDHAPLASLVADLRAELEAPDGDDVRHRVLVMNLLRVAGHPVATADIQPMLENKSSVIRLGAVMALGASPDTAARAALTPLLRDPELQVQQAAARILNRTP